jgi:hypothetical protein
MFVIGTRSQSPTPSAREIRKTQKEQSFGSQQPTGRDQLGTEKTPFVVKLLPAPKTQEEVAQETKDRADKTANDKKLVEFTRDLVAATLVLAAIGLLQLVVFGLQAHRLRQTVDAAAEQSAAMERSITEANRMASAMEKVANDIAISAKASADSIVAVKERTAKQMRAYLTVIIGTGVFQDRSKQLKFESKPFLVNSGHTPAHKVRYRAKARILPVPLPQDFDFPLSAEDVGAAMLGPQQNAVLSAIVDDFCNDEEVGAIKVGKEKALYIWGIVNYEDVFGESHYTRFCQMTTWMNDEKIWAYYIPQHNDAT